MMRGSAINGFRLCVTPTLLSAVMAMVKVIAKVMGMAMGKVIAMASTLAVVSVLMLASYSAHAVEPDPASSMEHVERFYRQRQFVQAIDQLRTLIQKHPEHALAWLRLGNALEQTDDQAQALAAYQAAAAIALPASTQFGFLEARQTRGKALLNLARLGLVQVRQVLDDYIRSGALHRELGELQQHRRQVDQRLHEAHHQALDQAPDQALAGPPSDRPAGIAP